MVEWVKAEQSKLYPGGNTEKKFESAASLHRAQQVTLIRIDKQEEGIWVILPKKSAKYWSQEGGQFPLKIPS